MTSIDCFKLLQTKAEELEELVSKYEEILKAEGKLREDLFLGFTLEHATMTIESDDMMQVEEIDFFYYDPAEIERVSKDFQ